ncbi:n-acetylglucosaminylphosphatidylinositol de-n-acetylase family protein [Lichtheimia corymbifera JMRC:FSU:9682]|uniref:N-acetylglucosaminylphosphatidylinositol deacetylase n=1 Tax=Lichtheimia corymbifera JMRC:FSU:9682 TaxID=1263082 RepID=A0A068SE76_9FUNG|nr:n-acetylglucosaminylphosphatidylinositol de-n-acetylase family protein [Lichtheimia corymbifera JMRC:FSU:9682]
MFFGPTIRALSSSKHRLHVLCLSTGNADRLGVVRKKELTQSCQVLGIPASNTRAIDQPELQDGMLNAWPPEAVSKQIKAYVSKHHIDTIITFDEYGVSGHPNHIAVYHGAKHYVTENQDILLYKLVSIRLPRKYIGVLDLLLVQVEKRLWPTFERAAVFVSSPSDYFVTHKAMRQHVSQLVWFRWLYVTFSRYMFINQLMAVNPAGRCNFKED